MMNPDRRDRLAHHTALQTAAHHFNFGQFGHPVMIASAAKPGALAPQALLTHRLDSPHSGSTIAAMTGITHVLIADWKSAIYTAAKTLALFLTTAAAFRLLQRRALAQFTPFDWLTTVVSGSVIGRAATATDASWIKATAAVLTLIAVNAAITRLRFVPGLNRLVHPPQLVLVSDGKVDYRNLRRCGLTKGDLGAILRQHGHLDAADVKLAQFEQTGSVSVLRSPAATSTGLPTDAGPAEP